MLIEAACFAHDLGHPPFGHGGETALQSEMRTSGGFEVNGHTLRLLTRLEQYKRQGWGINPTRRLVLAILKYPIPYRRSTPPVFASKPPKCYFDDDREVVHWALSGFDESDRIVLSERDKKQKAKHRSFDSSVMELADDIAYGVHDIEDIVARKLADQAKVRAALASVFAVIGDTLETNTGPIVLPPSRRIVRWQLNVNRHSRLVSAFITAVAISTRGSFGHPLLRYRAALPEMHRDLLDGLRDMSFDLVINEAPVRQLERRGMRIVSDVFRALQDDPEQLVPPGSWDDGDLSATADRRICDYVAGMTDSYAERVYRRLFVTRIAVAVTNCERYAFQTLLLRQHHPASERGELTICAGEVRLDPRRLRGPDTPERPATAAR